VGTVGGGAIGGMIGSEIGHRSRPMNTAEDTLDETTASVSSGWAPIPIEQLVQEVYGSSVHR